MDGEEITEHEDKAGNTSFLEIVVTGFLAIVFLFFIIKFLFF